MSRLGLEFARLIGSMALLCSRCEVNTFAPQAATRTTNIHYHPHIRQPTSTFHRLIRTATQSSRHLGVWCADVRLLSWRLHLSFDCCLPSIEHPRHVLHSSLHCWPCHDLTSHLTMMAHAMDTFSPPPLLIFFFFFFLHNVYYFLSVSRWLSVVEVVRVKGGVVSH